MVEVRLHSSGLRRDPDVVLLISVVLVPLPVPVPVQQLH